VDVEKDSSDDTSTEGEGKSSDKDNGSCSLVEECPEKIIFPGTLAFLLFGPLRELTRSGKSYALQNKSYAPIVPNFSAIITSS